MILCGNVRLRFSRLTLLAAGLLGLATPTVWSQSVPDSPAQAQERRAAQRPDEAAAPPEIPDDARQMLERFQADQRQAREMMEARLRAEKEALLVRLRELQDRYTRAGRLDEAVSVRDLIARMQAGQAKPPAPGGRINPMAFRGRTGLRYIVVIEGTTTGNVWGGENNIYSDDSDIATAAVHAGVVEPGKPGAVQITILPGQESYKSIARNDITSLAYGSWPGSYQIKPARTLHAYPAQTDLPPGATLQGYRDRVGQVFLFNIVGSTDGTIWGTDTYSDDSPLGTAAVHAGALAPGQSGLVRVRILPGMSSYIGSTRNGIVSVPWDAWGGSYTVQRVNSHSIRRLESTSPDVKPEPPPLEVRPVDPNAVPPAQEF